MRDGPALRVRAPEKSDRLLPLGRIRRIDNFGAMEWDTSALMACTDHSVSVYFHDRRGEIRAMLVPVHPQTVEPLGLLLENALADDRALEHLRGWLAARARIAINRIGGDAGLGNRKNRTRHVCDSLPGHARQTVRQLWTRFESLLLGDVLGCLWKEGFDPGNPLSGISGLDLPRELARVLILESLPTALNWLVEHTTPRKDRKHLSFNDLAALHTGMQGSIRRRLNNLLLQLHRDLLERP
jgi:hypothetical protein